MASPKDKLTADATRASTRGFGGYVADRALGRSDFSDEPMGMVGQAADKLSNRGKQIDTATDAAVSGKQNQHSPYTGRPHNRVDGD